MERSEQPMISILVEKEKNKTRLQNGLSGMFHLSKDTNTHPAVVLKSLSAVKQNARVKLEQIIFKTLKRIKNISDSLQFY